MSHPGAGAAQETGLPKDFDSWSQDDRDKYWLEHIYQPNERQLTIRAVGAGMLLGGVLAVANLYIGLKIGWSMGMALTSTILAFVVFRGLRAAGVIKTEFTMLENNTVASASSAAGYYCSAGMVSAIPALFITTGRILNWWELAFWMSAVSFVGVVMAVPMRRQMIDVDRLKFPSGTACAETIRSMHQSASEAVAKARALMYGALFAAVMEIPAQVTHFGKTVNWTFWKGVRAWPGLAGIKIAGKSLYAYSIAMPTSTLLYGAGAIMGIRVGLSMGIAALLLYGVGAPWLAAHGVVVINDEGALTYRSMLAWAVWPGVMGALAASLLQFGLKWRSIAQAFGTLGKLAKSDSQSSRMSAVEIPPMWFVWGLALSTLMVTLAARIIFGIPMWMSVLAVALSFVLSIVACRATGETDVTPIGALGKITQLTYAAIHPGSYATNLMTASITAGSASHSADLLTDLKTGYLLGGAPKRQFIAQFMGIVAGALFCVPAYAIVVGNGDRLGSASMPAPAAQTWAVVADLLANGVQNADRGPGQVTATAIQTVTVTERPAGLVIGDTLRIKEGPNAGDYQIVGIERKALVLDRDVPVAEVDTSEEPKPLGVEVLGPKGELRGGKAVAMLPNPGSRPAVKFTTLPPGTKVADFVRAEANGTEYFHQVKALRGDVAMLDHPFMVEGEGVHDVVVKKTTLPPYAMGAVIIAILAGIVITLLEVYGPKGLRAYLPSVTGVGIAFVITAHDSLAMTIGAVFAYVLSKTAPAIEERYNVAASSGIIAGASIAGLTLILLGEILKLLTLG